MNRERLYDVYARIQRLVAPTLRYAQYLYEDRLSALVSAEIKWLDLGCGHRVLPNWREREELELVKRSGCVIGFDYDWPSLLQHRSISLRVRGNITTLPFREDCFDLITANMVVEHLAAPELQFSEIHRVLKPGGKFLFHTPNAFGYSTLAARLLPEFFKAPLAGVLDGRPAGDVFRTFYKANTESHIRRIAEAAGLEVFKIQFAASTAKFAIIAPLAFIELLWIRVLLTRPFRRLRTNLIVTLHKPLTR